MEKSDQAVVSAPPYTVALSAGIQIRDFCAESLD
jgi:hypothetical protein